MQNNSSPDDFLVEFFLRFGTGICDDEFMDNHNWGVDATDGTYFEYHRATPPPDGKHNFYVHYYKLTARGLARVKEIADGKVQ